MSIEKSNDITGNRIRSFPACITALEPTTLLRATRLLYQAKPDSGGN
jgi:hypothetical protein